MSYENIMFITKHIGDKMNKIRKDKLDAWDENMKLENLAKKMWKKNYTNFSPILQWKRPWSIEIFKEIWLAIWMSEKEIDELILEARIEDIKNTNWISLLVPWDWQTSQEVLKELQEVNETLKKLGLK